MSLNKEDESFKQMDGKMKIITIGMAITVCLTALSGGCGKKIDLAVRYEMEKKLNEADRLQDRFKVRGGDLADSDLKSLVKAYSDVIKMTEMPDDSGDVPGASPELKQTWEIALLANTRIGALYQSNKDNDKAFTYFKIIADSPAANLTQRSAAINYMALCRENSGKYKEAIKMYQALADNYRHFIEPQNPNLDALNAPIKVADMWLALGDTAKYNSMLEQARQYYRQIKPLHPGTPFESAVMGKIVATYLKQNQNENAVRVMEETRSDSTGLLTPHVLMILADIHMNNTHDFARAEKAYREFVEAYPENKEIGPMTLGLAVSLYERGKYKEARDAVKNIEKLPSINNVTVAEAYYLGALCYEKEGRWEQAIGQFDLLAATFPGTDKAFEAGLYVANRYLAGDQQKLANQKFEETAEYIKKYTNPETSNPLQAARAYGYLVRCYTEMHDLDRTIETLQELAAKYPLAPEGRFAPLKLADLYENELHDRLKAIDWLKQFIKNNPEADDLDQIRAHIKKLERS